MNLLLCCEGHNLLALIVTFLSNCLEGEACSSETHLETQASERYF